MKRTADHVFAEIRRTNNPADANWMKAVSLSLNDLDDAAFGQFIELALRTHHSRVEEERGHDASQETIDRLNSTESLADKVWEQL